MYFYKNLTGLEFVKLIFKLKGQSFDQQQLIVLIEQLRLVEKIDQFISTYSLGTKQKLVLLIGFLLDYQYILMDEPFGAIDFITAEVVIDFLNVLKQQQKTIIVSTHLMDIAQELADEILFLHDGKIHPIKNNFGNVKDLKNYIRKIAI